MIKWMREFLSSNRICMFVSCTCVICFSMHVPVYISACMPVLFNNHSKAVLLSSALHWLLSFYVCTSCVCMSNAPGQCVYGATLVRPPGGVRQAEC